LAGKETSSETRIIANMRYVKFGTAKTESCSLLIENGIIKKKSNRSFEHLKDIPRTDLRGKYVIPGFIDAHTHLVAEGITMQRLDLGDCCSLDECLQMVQADLKKNDIVFASNWDEASWCVDDSKMLDRRMLDGISRKKPIVMRRVCGHYAVVNTVALRCIPARRRIVDRRGGKLYEDAALNLSEFFPPTDEMLENAVTLAGNRALRQGITSVHEISKPRYFRILQKKRKELKVRYAIYLTAKYHEHVLKTGLRSGYGDDWLKFAGTKIFLDGSIGARTAALRRPYSGTRQRGSILIPVCQLIRIVDTAEASGIQLMLHSIGDRTTETALRVLKKHAAPGNPLRHRLEHLEILSDESVSDIGRMKIIASMQPNFVYRWQNRGGLYQSILGPGYVAMNRFKSLLRANAQVVFGSDCMPIGPLYGIKGGVGHPSECERLTVAETFRLYTETGAFATFEEKRKGRLEPGCLADIVVLNENPLEEKNLARLKIQAVMVGGVIVYSRDKEKLAGK
jgi:predicted amidohydrolase YtcJ